MHTLRVQDTEYIIPRGCLREVARTPRNSEHENDLESIMRRLNETMVEDARERGLSVDSLGFAMMQAYREEQWRIENERLLRRATE